MAAVQDPALICEQTKVRNLTGKTVFFGFFPPRGKRLAPGEEYVFDGDLRQFFAAITKKRYRVSLYNALKAKAVAIVSTPSQHYYDETLDVTKILTIDNGVVTVADPCTGGYSSSIGG